MSNGLDFHAGVLNVQESRHFQRPIYDTGAVGAEIVHGFASVTIADLLTEEKYPLLASTWGYHSQTITPDQVHALTEELRKLLTEIADEGEVASELEALLRFAQDCHRQRHAIISQGP